MRVTCPKSKPTFRWRVREVDLPSGARASVHENALTVSCLCLHNNCNKHHRRLPDWNTPWLEDVYSLRQWNRYKFQNELKNFKHPWQIYGDKLKQLIGNCFFRVGGGGGDPYWQLAVTQATYHARSTPTLYLSFFFLLIYKRFIGMFTAEIKRSK